MGGGGGGWQHGTRNHIYIYIYIYIYVGPQPTMAAVSNLFLPPLLVHELTSLEPNVCWHHEKVVDQAERVMQVTISNLGSTDDTCSFKVHS